MHHIEKTGLVPLLREKVLEQGTPMLGICLGMQLMTEASAEGNLPGLGWIKAHTVRFPAEEGLRVPHMGWNTITAHKSCPLLTDLEAAGALLFRALLPGSVQSPEDVLTTTHYGHDFISAFACAAFSVCSSTLRKATGLACG